jgi:AFG3 family protein
MERCESNALPKFITIIKKQFQLVNMDEFNKEPNDNRPSGGPKFSFYWIYGVLAVVVLGMNLLSMSVQTRNLDWRKFEFMLQRGDVDRVVVVNKEVANVYVEKKKLGDSLYTDVAQTTFKYPNPGPHYSFNIGSVESFEERMNTAQSLLTADKKVHPVYTTETNWIGVILNWLLPFVLLIGLWVLIMRRVGGGGGGPGAQIFNIGKSKATLFDKDARVNVTFKDVAGLDEAKEEVVEIVDFLKNPRKYTTLGGKIPKGVLLVGPPGTGKTLLAKAVAGEAGVPFFSISGSDFVEMFVGVGASRVRDLFKQAREKAPCIIFIDEIDAVGRARGRNSLNGNDERENTLNQLLVEMDGFSTDKGVIIMAATNRPDVLDTALLRPGRFDRQISIDQPDLKGRAQIFKVHLKPLKVSPDVTSEALSELTPGFAGADIANVCNEAALVAARRGKKEIEMDDFMFALDRVIGGLEKKSKIISPNEKKVIAYHEAGHAICGWYLPYASPLLKVTIVPRGIGALGYAQYLPKEEYINTTEQMLDRMCMTLGGRAAESVFFQKISTGAQNDLDKVTKQAYAMVTIYGMNSKVGNVSFYDLMNNSTFAKPYSDETAKLIDDEVRILIEAQYARAQNLLREKSREVELLANALLEREVLLKSDVEKLIGVRPYDDFGLPIGHNIPADNIVNL